MSDHADTEAPNQAQIDYWNARGGSAWVPAQERTDAMLRAMGDAALAAAALEAGHRVLDVGCGCGDTTIAAAELVGPDGLAIGVDVSAPMLARGRQRAGGKDDVVFVQADAQTADLASLAVDRVVSRFGVMFFADPIAAFTNIATALVPDGRLSFVCWQTPEQNQWMGFAVRAVGDLLDFPPPVPGGPGPFAFGEADVVRDVVGGAGFRDVELTPLTGVNDLIGGTTIEEAVSNAIQMSPIPAMTTDDPALATEARERITVAFDEASEDGRLELPYSCWIVTASAPD